MSVPEGCERFALTDFNGQKPLLDAIDLAPGDALVALNSKFTPGGAMTRPGLTPYTTDTGDRVTSGFYFAQGQIGVQTECFAFLRQVLSTGEVTVQLFVLSTGNQYTILTLSGTINATAPHAVFTAVGARLYAAITQFNTSGVVTARGPYVWDGNTSNQMIACFQRPMKATEAGLALTQPGAGVVTAGTHYAGVIFQTKAGYWTKPGPTDASLVLAPQSIVSTGANNIRATLTPATTWPAWIAKVAVILTPADNSFEYYVVPGTETPITSGSGTVYTIDINIADIEMLSAEGQRTGGVRADDYFGLLSMDASNVQPFSVKAVIPWGQRLTWLVNYGGTDTLFPSDPLNPEWISADQHILQLPGGKPIGSAFVMRGVLYAVSSGGGLYSWVDNGGRPVSFSPPTTVDERVSTTGFYCTTVASGGGYALIASPAGLYAFSGGAFPTTPISFNQSPIYKTIAWSSTAEEKAQVMDVSTDHLILLKVPLSGGASTQILTWDYSRGMTPDRVNFSPWTAGLTTATPTMAITRQNGVWSVLIGDIKSFLRLKSLEAGDTGISVYSDQLASGGATVGIDWQYQTAPLPRLDDSPMLQHLGLRLRATALAGTPSIYVSAKSLDDVRTIALARSPIALSTAPGKEYLALYDAQEERVSYLFTNNSVVNAGMKVSRLTHFYNFFAEQR